MILYHSCKWKISNEALEIQKLSFWNKFLTRLVWLETVYRLKKIENIEKKVALESQINPNTTKNILLLGRRKWVTDTI